MRERRLYNRIEAAYQDQLDLHWRMSANGILAALSGRSEGGCQFADSGPTQIAPKRRILREDHKKTILSLAIVWRYHALFDPNKAY